MGYVSVAYIDSQHGMCIYVRSENDDDVILETKIMPPGQDEDDDVYKKQQACRNHNCNNVCS